jgi:hypothetical protein
MALMCHVLEFVQIYYTEPPLQACGSVVGYGTIQQIMGSIPDEINGFSIHLILPTHYGPGVDIARNLPSSNGHPMNEADTFIAICELVV